MAVLGLDLGTKMGFALRVGGKLHSGMYNFTPRRGAGEGDRFIRLRAWLFETKAQCVVAGDPLAFAIYELIQVRANDMNGIYAAQVYGGYKAIVTSFCEYNGIRYEGRPPQTIRKGAVGKGNAKKSEVTARLVALGYNPKTGDEADAIAALVYYENRERQACLIPK